MTCRGEAHLLSGQISEARQCAEAALQHAREHRERGHEVLALQLLGDVSAREGGTGWGEAEALYEQARTSAISLDMRPLSALCHLRLGDVLLKQSRPESAHGHLTQAVEMLRQMDMGFWLASATAHLRQLGVA
jgi:tetratricopeptide (TPR) repeat protein